MNDATYNLARLLSLTVECNYCFAFYIKKMSLAAIKKKLMQELEAELLQRKEKHAKQKAARGIYENECSFGDSEAMHRNKFTCMGSFSTTLVDEEARLAFIKRVIEKRRRSATKLSGVGVHIAVNLNTLVIHSIGNCDVMMTRPLEDLCDVIGDLGERMVALVLRHRQKPQIVCYLFRADNLDDVFELTRLLKVNNTVAAVFSTLAEITDTK